MATSSSATRVASSLNPSTRGSYCSRAEPVRVADGVGLSFGNLGAWAFSVSPRGALVFSSGTGVGVTQLTWFSRSGRRIDTVGEPGRYLSFAVSPDGREAMLERFDPKLGEVNLWLMELATGRRLEVLHGSRRASLGGGNTGVVTRRRSRAVRDLPRGGGAVAPVAEAPRSCSTTWVGSTTSRRTVSTRCW